MDRHTQSSQGTATGKKRPDRLLQTSLKAIASKAKAAPKHRFGGLYSLLNTTNLQAAYHRLNPRAAAGVDKVTHAEYGKDLDAHVAKMVSDLIGKRYHAKLIRRTHIPKGPNTTRPLGILTMSDKLAQRVAADILNAIYEQDFYDFSTAYRPGKDQRYAIRNLRESFFENRCGWVVEIDIKSFYDNLDRDWMMRMVSERVSDRAFLRLIGKWLRAGVMEEDGKVLHPATGTPQGGIISCVLANIYLHYALDSWFVKRFKPSCEGDAVLHRYADDTVAVFQYHREAVRYYREVKERLRKFGLEVSVEKSGIKRFNRFRKRDSDRFDFLGFEFRWGRTRYGTDTVKLRTSRKKLRQSLLTFKEWMRKHRNKRLRWIFAKVKSKLRGYYTYYGVTGNSPSLRVVRYHIRRIMYRQLNRRSERKSYSWRTFGQMLKHYRLPHPKVVWQLRQEQVTLAF
jgi:group II intron reverse transcriptase/maturase